MSDYNPIKIARQDGKTIRVEDLPPEAWNVVFGRTEGGGLQDIYSKVSWVFRAMDILYVNMMQLPFLIEDLNGNQVDDSEDYQNAVGFLPYPGGLFGLTEMAINAFGYSYLYRRPNLLGNKVFELRYMLPTSIDPLWAKTPEGKVTGLQGFKRKGAQDPLALQDVVYFWRADPWVEYGIPDSSPLKAAASEAGVILNINHYSSLYFERGAIKATLLAVSGNPPEKEKDRLKEWWGRLFKGKENAFNEGVINVDGLKPIVIGEGLEALADKNLTNEKREAIASALGIPHSMLFSSSAKGLGGGGVAQQDEVNLYKQKIIPDARFIAEKLNAQLLVPMGYRLKFTPERMDIFQDDESQRASSMNAFADVVEKAGSLEALRAFCLIFGYDVPEEAWSFLAQHFKAKSERAAAMSERLQGGTTPQPSPQNANQGDNTNQPVPPNPDAPQKRSDMERWKTKQVKWLKSGKTGAAPFESDEIRPALAGAIAGALETVKNLEDVELVFSDVWAGYP